MSDYGRIALGSMAGAALAAAAAPLIKPLFSVPSQGVGAVTVAGYPKGWDHAVVALLALGAFIGGAVIVFLWSSAAKGVRYQVSGVFRPGDKPQTPDTRHHPGTVWSLAALVFLTMLFVHDHPYAHMDPFHEGERLVPAWLYQNGARPFRDVFVLHGLATDGGLDALVLGEPPNPLRTRRLQTVLDALVLALLVPIAAEVTVTSGGLIAAVLGSLCASAAFWVPVFPYFRLAPVFLAVLGLLRYVRTGRGLMLAFASSTLGLLWSVDTGTYAVVGTAVAFAIIRIAKLERHPLPLKRVLVYGAIALLLPIVVLLAVRGDVRQFFVDSYVIIPATSDAAGALPAPKPFTVVGARYYLPPVFYGFLFAIALLHLRRGEKLIAAQIGIIALLSLLLFRSASGRVGWSHTRFATIFLGIAIVGFVLERLRSKVAVALIAIAMIFYLEVPQNVQAGAKLLAGWRARQKPEGLVRHPLVRGIYTSEENAIELSTLNSYIQSLGPGPILDFTNERALYLFLRRKPPARAFDIGMLSSPRLMRETMAELERNRPVAVILGGYPAVAVFDGVPNQQRVPQLAAWIDAHYTQRTEIGRFTVATP